MTRCSDIRVPTDMFLVVCVHHMQHLYHMTEVSHLGHIKKFMNGVKMILYYILCFKVDGSIFSCVIFWYFPTFHIGDYYIYLHYNLTPPSAQHLLKIQCHNNRIKGWGFFFKNTVWSKFGLSCSHVLPLTHTVQYCSNKDEQPAVLPSFPHTGVAK